MKAQQQTATQKRENFTKSRKVIEHTAKQQQQHSERVEKGVQWFLCNFLSRAVQSTIQSPIVLSRQNLMKSSEEI